MEQQRQRVPVDRPDHRPHLLLRMRKRNRERRQLRKRRLGLRKQRMRLRLGLQQLLLREQLHLRLYLRE